ncbi:MAG: hypothetical protein ACREUE_15435 [Panacagrimonas sp.]
MKPVMFAAAGSLAIILPQQQQAGLCDREAGRWVQVSKRLLGWAVPTAEAGANRGTCAMVLASQGVRGGDQGAGVAADHGGKGSQESSTATPQMALGGGCSIVRPEHTLAMADAAATTVSDVGPAHDEGGAAQPVAQSGKVSESPLQPDAVAESAGEAMKEEVATTAPISRPVRRNRLRTIPESAKKAWWPATVSGKLNLTYAGEASFTGAIALLFDGAFKSAGSANQNIQVIDGNGSPIHGNWLVSTNRQMLLFGAPPGLYTVSVGAGLVDQGGRSVSSPSEGPVFVR